MCCRSTRDGQSWPKKTGKFCSRCKSWHVWRAPLLATKLLEKKLYAGQDQIMLSLAANDGQTPGALASEIGVRPPTITKTISRLQAQGFLEKRGSETDARQAAYFPDRMPEREAIVAIEKSIKKTEKHALGNLDKKDRKQLFKLLKKIEGNLSDLTDEADLDDDSDDGDEETSAAQTDTDKKSSDKKAKKSKDMPLQAMPAPVVASQVEDGEYSKD